MVPQLGDTVIFEANENVLSPAVVLRTQSTTIPGLIERWVSKGGPTNSGARAPLGIVPELPDSTTVDLLVHGLGGDYRAFCVPYAPDGGANTWREQA